jgi:hypothetical protein
MKEEVRMVSIKRLGQSASLPQITELGDDVTAPYMGVNNGDLKKDECVSVFCSNIRGLTTMTTNTSNLFIFSSKLTCNMAFERYFREHYCWLLSFIVERIFFSQSCNKHRVCHLPAYCKFYYSYLII